MRHYTREQCEQYLIDCLGYSITDCDDMTTHEMRDLIYDLEESLEKDERSVKEESKHRKEWMS